MALQEMLLSLPVWVQLVAVVAVVPILALPVVVWDFKLVRGGRGVRGEGGIALQTVIVIVVMLAIAGGVAGVLLSRGNEVTEDLEKASVGPDLSQYQEATCKAAGHVWIGTPTVAVAAASSGTATLVAGNGSDKSGEYIGDIAADHSAVLAANTAVDKCYAKA